MRHTTESPHHRNDETREDLAEAREPARGHERTAEHERREALREGDGHAHLGQPGTTGSPGSGATAGATGAMHGNDRSLLGDEHRRRFRSRWDAIQASFVDEPRTSVAEADALVREATETLHSQFERDRRQLEGAWDRGDDVSTEDLRVTLQRYRSFFDRLLTI